MNKVRESKGMPDVASAGLGSWRCEKMTRFGYHVSHEQFAPSDLLRWTKRAEEAGFDRAMSSDHFHPWSERQGQSGFAWSWLGAAREPASPFGIISAPGYRYHPAVIAQGAATLSQKYPDRLWLALGSGKRSTNP
jgi:coenzyme F420-dependent glucose-6-phosphate dehydrogenase